MRKIELDASQWTTAKDFYTALLPALGAPPGHSMGIDPIIDSIIGGGMNAVEPPYVIAISNTSHLDEATLDHLKLAKTYLAEARDDVRSEWGDDVEASIDIVS